jgi:glucosamine--fructose-6-phosphate aminotransferase (isomerizing)
LAGLKKLEYRGYDSTGIAVIDRNQLSVVRAAGKLKNLEMRLKSDSPKGTIGIGHTRWATHGRPSDENAHPHTYDGVAVVHNGIMENHLVLKKELLAKGHTFSSETDTEVFAHLIVDQLRHGLDFPTAIRAAVSKVKGTYALAVISTRDPRRIVATKDASPLVLGLSNGQNFIASDIPALLEHTREFIHMEEGDLAVIAEDHVEVFDRGGERVHRPTRRVDWTPVMAEKGGHKHFMHKEIWEQPRAVADTLRGRVLLSEGDVYLEGWNWTPDRVRELTRVNLLACGTSWHSALVGRHMIEKLARVPVEVDLGSEFRYRDPLIDSSQLAIAISQSGETADTLAAMREAKSRGATTLAICNVMGSVMTREADFTLITNAGPEIGVASTKAFTTQLAALYLLAVKLGRARGTLTAAEAQHYLTQVTEIPKLMEEVLQCERNTEAIAKRFYNAQGFLFLGRGPMFPVALEGALKLKEISYIHAEGYAGGEMKHGPIALIDENLPVVVIAPKEPEIPYEKILGNIQEVRARGATVIAIADDDDEHVPTVAQHLIKVPPAAALLAPIIATVPLQLLAYHIADLRGTDVDQPRNLAKSVTVE